MTISLTKVKWTRRYLLWDYAGSVGQIPLTYKSHLQEASPTTVRNIYSVLASQYVPLGFIPPFTTRAKILVQLLWNNNNNREWDDPLLPGVILEAWKSKLQYSVCLAIM